jgi:hypothetical protein
MLEKYLSLETSDMENFEKKKYLACKYLLNKNFIINALKWYYFSNITKAEETEKYFKKYGGDNWKEKFEMSKHFKDYQSHISSDKFKEQLKLCLDKCILDLVSLIENTYSDEEIENLDLNGIYYTYGQVYVQLNTQ